MADIWSKQGIGYGAQMVSDPSRNRFEPHPESFANRLQQIEEVLARSENFLESVLTKLDGPTPRDANKLPDEPKSISALIMEINNISQRVLQIAEGLDNRLA